MQMKKILALITMAAMFCCLAVDFPLLERFDSPDSIKGTVSGGAVVSKDMGVEKGALQAIGDGSPNKVIYSVELPAQGGKSYALAFNYRTENLQNYAFRIDVLFEGAAAKPMSWNLVASRHRWTHKIYEFTAPDGVTGATLRLRLTGAPKGSQLLVDFLRMAPMVNGIARGIHITDFETAFDGWIFNKHLIFDHFMLAPGSSIVNEWKEAKVGEAFLKAVGTGEPMQYAFYIDNLKVTGNCSYIFEAWHKATDIFRFNAKGMLIFFYKDANGKAIGQSRYHIRPTGGEWKEFLHTFTVPANCEWVDIGLNMRRLKETDVILFDHMRFKQGKSEVYLRTAVDPDTKSLELVNALSGDLSKDKITSSSIIIRKAGASEALAKLDATPGEKLTVDISKYTDGPYTIQYEVSMQDGTSLKSAECKLQICNNPSWSNDLGIQKPDDEASAPWKNLEHKGNTVTTWNSTFDFNDSMQLQGIRQANGKKLLLKPLEFKINGQSIFTGKKANWSGGRSLSTGTSSFEGAGFTGTIQAGVDYCGFLHYIIDIKAAKDIELENGVLELENQKLDFVHRSDDSWTSIGAIDLNAKKSWKTKHFFNEIHFGTVDEGLAWYAPKAYPAVENFENEWFSISSDGSASLTMINSKLVLKKGQSHRIEFAIMPYPFRPAAENWRTLRFRAGDYKNLDLIWQSSGHFTYAGSTAAISKPEEIKQIIANKTGKLLFYQFPFYIMDNIPEWSYFEKKWKGIPARAYDMRSMGGMAHKADISQRTWQDLYLKIFVDALNKFDWDGVYYDCFGTDIFQKNGETYHPTFDTKFFQERIYNAQRLKNKNSLTITHMGGAQANTAAIYSDAVLMGEQYRAKCSGHTFYMEFLTLDEFRYENAVNIGPDRMFLPQFHDNEKINNPLLGSHIMGLVLLHNLMLYPNFIRKDLELRVRYRQYEFGMENSTFHPYWKNEDHIFKSSNTQVKTSYYSNAKGYLLTAFNPTAQEQSFKLSGKNTAWTGTSYDAATDRETKVNGDSTITLKPYQPAFIIIKK